MIQRTLIAAIACTAGSVAPVAAGDDAAPVSSDDEIIIVTDSRPGAGIEGIDGPGTRSPDAERGLREPVFVTVVRTGDRTGEGASTAQVMASSLGVQVRSLGGLGSFSALSMRGAPPGHTAVLVDGIPLSRISTPVTDLGLFELGSFEQLEIYRGGVPVELGGAALGGAVNFTTAVGRASDGHRAALTLGVGSFGRRALRLRWGDDALEHALGYHLAISYGGATGDYPYFNNNGTDLNTADDTTARRANNGYHQLSAVARGRYVADRYVVSGGVRSSWKQQGVPGVASIQTESASLGTATQLADVNARMRTKSGWLLRGAAFGILQQEHFLDLEGEVGLGFQDNRYRTAVAGVSAAASHSLGTGHLLALGTELRLDDFAADQRLDARAPRGRRYGGSVSVDDTVALLHGRLTIVPALRIDASSIDPGSDWDGLVVDPEGLAPRSTLSASPRVAARSRIGAGAAIKASAGRYFREPTVTELFGDRGVVLGDPSLRPETGENVDLGIVWAPAVAHGPVDRIYVETALFGARSRDTIVLQATSGDVARVSNLGAATRWGAEAAAHFRVWRRLAVTANYTLLDTRQHDTSLSFEGKQLPGRPRHHGYARVDLAARPAGKLLVVWADAQYIGSNFRDRANSDTVPERRLFGAGAKFVPASGVVAAVELRNLMDRRVETVSLHPAPRPDLTQVDRAIADFLGYPLPGRSIYCSLQWAF